MKITYSYSCFSSAGHLPTSLRCWRTDSTLLVGLELPLEVEKPSGVVFVCKRACGDVGGREGDVFCNFRKGLE